MNALFTTPDVLNLVLEHVSPASLSTLPQVSNTVRSALDWKKEREARFTRFKDGVKYVAHGNEWLKQTDIITVKRKQPTTNLARFGAGHKRVKIWMDWDGVERILVDPYFPHKSRVMTAKDVFNESMRDGIEKANWYVHFSPLPNPTMGLP